jgi:hypothetical protein
MVNLLAQKGSEETFVEVLRVHLRLTFYEAIALIAVINGKSEPTSVADFNLAGFRIPKSKAYDALKSLEKKGYIARTDNGGYQPRSTEIDAKADTLDDFTNGYKHFFKSIVDLARYHAKSSQDIEKTIIDFLENKGYKISREKVQLPRLSDKESLGTYRRRGVLDRIDDTKNSIRKIEFELEKLNKKLPDLRKPIDTREITTIEQLIRFKEEHKKRLQDTLFMYQRRLESLDPQRMGEVSYPVLITHSSNSGIDVAIILDSEEGEDIASLHKKLYLALDELRDNVGITVGIILTPSPLEAEDISRAFMMRYRVQMHIVSTKREYLKEIEDVLTQLDSRWRILKKTLHQLDTDCSNAKRFIRVLMNRIEGISKDDRHLDTLKDVFENIQNRIKKDLEADDKLLSELDDHIHNHFSMLNRKDLFTVEDLEDIQSRLDSIRGTLKEKEKEISHFQDELLSIPGDKNPYLKYGLKFNPFSISVPLDAPSSMINQVKAKDIAIDFIKGVIMGSDSNLMWIIGKQGVGKSHFSNYFANKINSGEYGKALAVRIECKTNKDIIDLYPQLFEGLKRDLNHKEEKELDEQVTKIREEAGSPRFVQDLMNTPVPLDDVSEQVTKILEEAGSPRFVQDLMRTLSQIESLILKKGYNGIFIFIDEFENTLPPIHEHHEHSDYSFSRRLRMVTPESIWQMDSLTKLSGIGFIVTLRDEDYESRKDEIHKNITKMDKDLIVNIEELSVEDAKSFLESRLEGNEFCTSSTTNIAKPSISDETYKALWSEAKGNPRALLRITSNIFRKAIHTGRKVIEPGMIKEYLLAKDF